MGASAGSTTGTITINYFGHEHELYETRASGRPSGNRSIGNVFEYTNRGSIKKGQPEFTLTFYSNVGATAKLTVRNGPKLDGKLMPERFGPLTEVDGKIVPNTDSLDWTIVAFASSLNGERVLILGRYGWRYRSSDTPASDSNNLPEGWTKGDKYDSNDHCFTHYFDKGIDQGRVHPRELNQHCIVLKRNVV